MSEPASTQEPAASATPKPVPVEADAYGFCWRNDPSSTLPPPDLQSAYNRHKPLAPKGVEKRRAFIVGSGIAGLAAAFYLIRDGGMPGTNITILDEAGVAGGSLDGSGDAETGYLVRGGREMCFTYENFWDLFQDIPALELPERYSVLDEYRLVNDNDKTHSKARLMHRQGRIKDFSTFGLSRPQQLELTRLLLMRKEKLDDVTVGQFFSKGFLETNFWAFWQTMFAFQTWHSVLEMKLYMHRFLDLIDGLHDMSSLVFPKYDQYDSFVRPLTRWLADKGVEIRLGVQVHDLALETEGDTKTVTGILCTRDGRSETIPVGALDMVVALTGSMTEGTAYGDLETAPVLAVDRHRPRDDSGWTLWRNLATKSPVFGRPEKFCGDVDRSIWESATLTCKPSPLVEKLRELAVNDPYSGKAVTGGIITFVDFELAAQLHLQPPAALPGPAEGRAGPVGLCPPHGSGGRLREETDACLHRARDFGGALLAPRDRRQARRGRGQHEGASGAHALHHRAVHAARGGRPAARRPRRLRQPRPRRPVRRDEQRRGLHRRKLRQDGTDRGLQPARPAQAGPGHRAHPV